LYSYKLCLLDNISFNGKLRLGGGIISISNIQKKIRQSGYYLNLTTVKKLKNNYKVCTFKIPIKQKGFERNFSSKCSVNSEKLLNNLIRAKTKVREYALCNNFEYFATFTLDKSKYDRYDLSKFIKDLGQFIRDYRKKYKANIQYILIPEKHQDGAWHMHGLLMGIKKEHLINFDNIPGAPKKLKNKGYYNFVLYQKKFGFNSFGEIKDRDKVANYITKYIIKDFGKDIEMNCKSYYCSRGLKKATEIKKGLLLSPLSYDFENEYVAIKNLPNIDNVIIDEDY